MFTEAAFDAFFEAFALSLMHFVWQGGLIAFAVFALNWMLRRYSANERYLISLLGLLAMVVCLPANIVYFAMDREPSADQAISTSASLTSKHVPEQLSTVASPSLEQSRIDTLDSTSQLRVSDSRPLDKSPNSWLGKSLSKWAVVVYVFGVVAMTCRLWAGMLGGRRLGQQSKPISDVEFLGRLELLSKRLALRSIPKIAHCDRVSMPVVIGVLRPMILLPTVSVTGLNVDQLEAIFLHELAHIRRYDLAAQLFQRATECALFFHPAAWYVSRQVSLERECCCDELVVGLGVGRLEYASMLVQLAEAFTDNREHSAIALSAAGNGQSQFNRRILRLLAPQPLRLSRGGVLLAALLTAFVLAIPVTAYRVVGTASAAPSPSPVQVEQDKNEQRDGEKEVGEQEVGEKAQRGQREKDEVRGDILKQMERELGSKQYQRVVDRFSQELQDELTAARLSEMIGELEALYGPIVRFDYGGVSSVGVARLYSIGIKWRSMQMSLRLDMDEQDRISGVWIDAPDGIAEPEIGRVHYGKSIETLIAFEHQLVINVQSISARPAGMCTFWLYRGVPLVSEPGRHDWVESPEKFWKHVNVKSGDGLTVFDHLEPGTYRVFVALQGNKIDEGQFGLSDHIVIQAGQQKASRTVTLQRGGKISVAPIDSEQNLLDKTSVYVQRVDSRWPKLSLRGSKVDGRYDFSFLPSGKYEVTGYQRAKTWDGEQYDPTKPIVVELQEGESKDIDLPMKARRLTDKEISVRAPWVAEGFVKDGNGNPVEGAEVWGSAGIGSLFSMKIGTTNKEGYYRGRFSTSGWISTRSDSTAIVGAQSHVRKTGYAEKNLCRHSRAHAATSRPKPDKELPKGFDAKRLYLPDVPVRTDFVMKPCAKMTLLVRDAEGKPMRETKAWLSGKDLPPASSVVGSAKTNAEGVCKFETVPTGYDWRLDVQLGDRKSAKSRAMSLNAGEYAVVAQLATEPQTGREYFRLISATDATGKDVSSEIITTNPLSRPPMSESDQARGRRLIEKIAEANRYWIGAAPKEVGAFAFKFQLQGKETQTVRVDPGQTRHRRGVSYFSAIDSMVDDPTQVVFRAIESKGDEVHLYYSAKKPFSTRAGNGITKNWKGYFSRGVSDGKLVIDAKRLVPLSHESDGVVETYTNYTAVDDEHFVPLRIEISRYGYDWHFRLHEHNLWLFDRSESEVDGQPLISVSDVRFAD